MKKNMSELKKAPDFEVLKSHQYPITLDAEAGRFARSNVCGGYADPRQIRAWGKTWEKDVLTMDIFTAIE